MLNTLNDSYYYLPLSLLSAVITISKVFVYICMYLEEGQRFLNLKSLENAQF